MKIPRHWVRSEREVFEAPVYSWGWSETSREEAERRAERSVTRLAEWLHNADRGAEMPDQWYGYDVRPAREEVLEELHDDRGEAHAFVTRNRYGVLVLNTRDLVFVDADVPPVRVVGKIAAGLKRLFGKPAPPPPEQAVLDRVRGWSEQNPGVGLRLYRTAAGFRGLVTNRAIDARDADADALLAAMGSDPLYRRLCRSQECYRARLTPKPWRVGWRAPSGQWPWGDAAAEAAFEAWRRTYEQRCEAFATCRLVEQLGPNETLPKLLPLIERHDRLTRCDSDKPLA